MIGDAGSETVFWRGEGLSPDFRDIFRNGLLRHGADAAEPSGMLREESFGIAEQIADDLDLAVAVRPCADADGRHADGGGDLRGQRGGDAFQHHGENAGVLKFLCAGNECGGLFIAASLHPVAAGRFHGLRQKADMPLDGDARLDECADGGQGGRGAFELDRVASGFLHEPCRLAERVLHAEMAGHERHVADDEGVRSAAADALRVVHHHVHGGGDGVGISERVHGERIAHEDEVDSGGFGEGRGRGVVGGDHHDLFPFLLHFPERPDCFFYDAV